MPIFTYVNDAETETRDEFFESGPCPRTIVRNKKKWQYSVVATHAGRLGVQTESSPGWPILSEAAGCLPKNMKAEVAALKKHGVPTEYRLAGDGLSARPVLRNPTHRRRYLKAMKMYDKKAYC